MMHHVFSVSQKVYHVQFMVERSIQTKKNGSRAQQQIHLQLMPTERKVILYQGSFVTALAYINTNILFLHSGWHTSCSPVWIQGTTWPGGCRTHLRHIYNNTNRHCNSIVGWSPLQSFGQGHCLSIDACSKKCKAQQLQMVQHGV